jgi:ParB-like chromosome segregation protein Spo0J
LIHSRHRDYSQPVQCWADENLLELECKEIGEHYGRYRLHLPEAERAMARSLERYGQLSPVVVCRRQGRYELIDGFKRLGAARGLARLSHLWARLMEADERTAKAAIYGLNSAGGRTRELEEAWIIQALVREDGMSQVEVAELLGRHKSWVCRRLALIERLGPKARDELRVGLLSPTAPRQIVRLPQGNQAAALEAIRREALSGARGRRGRPMAGLRRTAAAAITSCDIPGMCLPNRTQPSGLRSIPAWVKMVTVSGNAWGCCSMCWAVWKCGWRIRAAPG